MPDSYREGSFGLGAGRLRTVFHIVLPRGRAGHSGRRHSGHRPHCRARPRRSSTPPAPWHRFRTSGRRLFESGRTLCRAHVCALQRGPAHRTRRTPQRSCCWLSSCGINALSAFVAKQTEQGKAREDHMDERYLKLQSRSEFVLRRFPRAQKHQSGHSAERDHRVHRAFRLRQKSTLLKSLNRMNDLVEGCRITGAVKLDGEDIYARHGRQPSAQARRHGVPKAEPVPDERVRQHRLRPAHARHPLQGAAR